MCNHENVIPGGSPNRLLLQVFDLDYLAPNGFDIYTAARNMSPNIAYFLPRNTSVKQVGYIFSYISYFSLHHILPFVILLHFPSFCEVLRDCSCYDLLVTGRNL